jgi:hypothetical protein
MDAKNGKNGKKEGKGRERRAYGFWHSNNGGSGGGVEFPRRAGD